MCLRKYTQNNREKTKKKIQTLKKVELEILYIFKNN